jgi:hypothetical protein
MKRFSLILACIALLSGTKASAFVGGPFDNGDYSGLLDNNGIYQTALQFSNGSGFAQFGNNVDVALFVDFNSSGTFTRGSTYSFLNRSIIYYKGVTYLGTCMGMVDHEAKTVQGTTNANSDVNTTTVNNNFLGTGTGTTAATTTLQNNGGAGLTCNTNWNCKITKSYPVLRYSGSGELSVLNPSLGQVTLQAISAIINGNGNNNNGGGIIIGVVLDSIGEQISDLLDAVSSNQAAIEGIIPTAQQIRDNSDHVPLKAFGSRIFFIGRR